MTIASAPGKVILCGEHAVVYGHPAIALPLSDVRATAVLQPAAPATITLDLPDVDAHVDVLADRSHPLAMLVHATLEHLGARSLSGFSITVRSSIPIASGMGSGAAIGVALVKAVAAHAGAVLDPAVLARLVYESERFFHGTPSGIDNTVVSYEQAVWFVRGTEGQSPTIEPVQIGQPLTLVIGDTGVRAPTLVTVGGVRERWLREPDRFNTLFEAIGATVRRARSHLQDGALEALGQALNDDQVLLQEIGVSSPELERLVAAANTAGALGSKLSGGGGGGIMLALVRPEDRDQVAGALRDAGATQVLSTRIG